MPGENIFDRNFDDLADRLKNRVYGSAKGRLRIELVWDDLSKHMAGVNGNKPLNILDAGGGFGQISLKLAGLGHRIVICDHSEKMLDGAAEAFEKEGLSGQLTIIHSPFQELPETYISGFDVIMSHAVMEWLADPESSLRTLLRYLKPQGLVSLMFYNLHSLIHQNAIKGNFRKVTTEAFSGEPNGLTPFNPLPPEEVEAWLVDEGITVIAKTGIRVFYDYMNKKLRQKRSFEDVLEVEKLYCRKEPFASLGKYIHFIGKPTGGVDYE